MLTRRVRMSEGRAFREGPQNQRESEIKGGSVQGGKEELVGEGKTSYTATKRGIQIVPTGLFFWGEERGKSAIQKREGQKVFLQKEDYHQKGKRKRGILKILEGVSGEICHGLASLR